MTQISNEQIEQLKREAALAGDDAQVECCEAALNGDEAARAECARVIHTNQLEGLEGT